MERSVLVPGLQFPESPRWWNGELWFVDGPSVKVLRANGKLCVHTEIQCPLLIGLTATPRGGYLVGDAIGRRIWSVSERGKADLFIDLSGTTPFMINEIMTLADGSLIVSDIGFDVLNGAEPKAARLIRVAADKSISRTGSAMLFANGMVSVGNGSEIFVAETFGQRIWHYRLAESGGLDAGHPIATGCVGIDGLALAPDSTFWYASHVSGDVVHLDDGGQELSRLASGFSHATSCVLNDDGSALYITAVPVMPSADSALSNNGAIVRVLL
jgi:sugar lactone lactonase YvrE